MKIRYIKQINSNDLTQINFDLIIASSGYESRATYISQKYSQFCKEKIVLSFTNYQNEEIRVKNDTEFNNLKFKPIKIDEGDSSYIINFLKSFISSQTKELNILIDYSSMTRVWYGSVVSYFKNIEIVNQKINIFFSYSASMIHKPSEKESMTTHFEPIEGFCNLTVPSIPTALITGLGYEKNKTFGLKEFFDANLLYLFYTSGNDFTNYVINKNKEIINTTLPEYLIPYNINDILLTKTRLYDICLSLKNKFRIIIAPCGPKPFTLLSFLVASELDSVDVWRISGNEISSDKKPNGDIISFVIGYE